MGKASPLARFLRHRLLRASQGMLREAGNRRTQILLRRCYVDVSQELCGVLKYILTLSKGTQSYP